MAFSGLAKSSAFAVTGRADTGEKKCGTCHISESGVGSLESGAYKYCFKLVTPDSRLKNVARATLVDEVMEVVERVGENLRVLERS